MSSRQLLGAAAVMAVLASVIWYLATASSRAGGITPQTTPEVALTATATGGGTWVRYLVTVKNLADGDFDGDVLLIDQAQTAETSAGTSVPAIGRTAHIPSAPAVAGQSAYQV